MNLNDLIYELGDDYEDFLAIHEHNFDVDPFWNQEIDIEYAQGDFQ